VAAAGIAAHETGHALQDAEHYLPLEARTYIVPAVQLASKIAPWLFVAGVMLQLPTLAWVGIILFGSSSLFAFLTLPVEFNASTRAQELLLSPVLQRCQMAAGRAVKRGARAMTERDPHAAPSSVPEVTTAPDAPPKHRHASFWLRELPFTIVSILTIAGVAYTSFSKQPIVTYWEILAPIIGLVCIGSGWHEAGDKTGRLRLIVMQALHWGAFLLVMNILLLSSVQRIFTAQTSSSATLPWWTWCGS
jgi:hypothetical protein